MKIGNLALFLVVVAVLTTASVTAFAQDAEITLNHPDVRQQKMQEAQAIAQEPDGNISVFGIYGRGKHHLIKVEPDRVYVLDHAGDYAVLVPHRVATGKTLVNGVIEPVYHCRNYAQRPWPQTVCDSRVLFTNTDNSQPVLGKKHLFETVFPQVAQALLADTNTQVVFVGTSSIQAIKKVWTWQQVLDATEAETDNLIKQKVAKLVKASNVGSTVDTNTELAWSRAAHLYAQWLQFAQGHQQKDALQNLADNRIGFKAMSETVYFGACPEDIDGQDPNADQDLDCFVANRVEAIQINNLETTWTAENTTPPILPPCNSSADQVPTAANDSMSCELWGNPLTCPFNFCDGHGTADTSMLGIDFFDVQMVYIQKHGKNDSVYWKPYCQLRVADMRWVVADDNNFTWLRSDEEGEVKTYLGGPSGWMEETLPCGRDLERLYQGAFHNSPHANYCDFWEFYFPIPQGKKSWWTTAGIIYFTIDDKGQCINNAWGGYIPDSPASVVSEAGTVKNRISASLCFSFTKEGKTGDYGAWQVQACIGKNWSLPQNNDQGSWEVLKKRHTKYIKKSE